MPIKLTFFLLLLLCFGYTQQGIGQKNVIYQGQIRGLILEKETGKSIPSSAVSISKKSSNYRQVLIADKTGFFQFQQLDTGIYQIAIDILGFSKITIDSIVVSASKFEHDLGEVLLQDATLALSEVLVYASKPLIEAKDGMLIYNVGESAMSSGSNASEVLKSLPMMQVSPDGSIQMKGKEPLILMDEKPINVTGAQLTEFLESLPAQVIEKVEVMQNPPAGYANYPGGVINIVTRKGRMGVYKKVTISAGTRGEAALSATYNYRAGAINFSGSVGVNGGENRGSANSVRLNNYNDSTNQFVSKSIFKNQNKSPSARMQLGIDLTKKASLNLVYQGNHNYFINQNHASFNQVSKDGLIYKASSRTNSYEGLGYSHGFSAAYQWRGKHPVQKFSVNSGINFGKNENDRDFFQQYLQSDFLPTGLDSTQIQITDNYTRSYYLNSHYQKPLNDSGNTYFTVGLNVNNNLYHNILSTSFLRKLDQQFIVNDLLSNNFYFLQQVYMIRAGIVVSLPLKFVLIAGAQAEQTVMNFEFIKGNSANANNQYWNFFPAITLRKDFKLKTSVSIVYRETIRRPGLAELNPSIDYSDPYNIRFGNPFLKPSITHHLEFNFGKSNEKGTNSFNVSFGFNQIKNSYTSIRTLVDSGKTQITFQNISDQKELHGAFWVAINPFHKLRLSFSAGYQYHFYNEREKLLFRYVDGGAFYSGLNYSYTITPLLVLEGNNRYNSFRSPQGNARSNINMSLAIQQKLFKKKVNLGFQAIDPLGLQKFSGVTIGPNFIIHSSSISNTQNFRINLSYQVSKSLLKKFLPK